MNDRGHRPALLIIDMISLFDFAGAHRIAPRALQAAGRIAWLRGRFHARDWPVIYSNDNFAHWRSDFRELVAMAEATRGAASGIAALLRPGPEDHALLKPKHSAFLATALPVLLAKLEIRRLLLTGMALEGCVLATALDAKAREHETAIVTDAVAGMAHLHDPALRLLSGTRTAHVADARRALRWAGRTAGTRH